MAQFKYKARTPEGDTRESVIEAASPDLAVSALQRRNFLVLSLESAAEGAERFSWLTSLFASIPEKEIVILTRQLTTLFEAKIPIVEALKILVGETENKLLKQNLADLLADIQGGTPLSQAMAKHPNVFSKFYVAMVRSGEESGKLEEIFRFLADYIERSYELARRARNALIYPAFILASFVIVMTLMLVFVIPNLATILIESGQEIPIYTKIVIGFSSFLRSFGLVLLALIAVLAVFLGRYAKTENGKLYFAKLLISMPVLGGLYKKIYLSRIADNLHTLLSGGISVVQALGITSEVVGNEIYRRILLEAVESVKGGNMISDSFSKYADMPPLLSQMIRIGEETGKLDYILSSIAGFYRRDVDAFVENLVSLIEPVLILALGLGVGILVASVLIPIYNVATGF